MRGVALHGLDEVRDQAAPALELDIDARPGFLHADAGAGEAVVMPITQKTSRSTTTAMTMSVIMRATRGSLLGGNRKILPQGRERAGNDGRERTNPKLRCRGEVRRFHLSKADIARESPVIGDAIRVLRERNLAGVEYGIALLEADPWCFRSGYLKATLARQLRKTLLSETQRERLRTAILNTLDKGNRLEFGETRKLARRAGHAEVPEEQSASS